MLSFCQIAGGIAACSRQERKRLGRNARPRRSDKSPTADPQGPGAVPVGTGVHHSPVRGLPRRAEDEDPVGTRAPGNRRRYKLCHGWQQPFIDPLDLAIPAK